MTRAGAYKEREPGSLRDAASALVTACGGSDRAAAIATDALGRRISKSQIARYTEDAAEDAPPNTHMPADIIRVLERHCGVAHVSRSLAMSAGAVLVPLPHDGSHKACMHHLAAIGRDTGTLYSNACEALADGTMTPRERARVRAEAMKTMTALAALLSDLNAPEASHG